MQATFLCHPTCTTCKKAQAWLDQHQIAYTWRDIREQNPTKQELTAWHKNSTLPIKRFFNTSGMAYREMGLSKKLPDMTLEQQLELLCTDGMLVKRPIFIKGDRVLIGFKPQEWEQALLTSII